MIQYKFIVALVMLLGLSQTRENNIVKRMMCHIPINFIYQSFQDFSDYASMSSAGHMRWHKEKKSKNWYSFSSIRC
ncbi:hypothetical protein MA16_Dca023160 [Dendrobium catenatum]|uniref:Uncharacterized protein n=1 Tax=Dendrobium catenatum TaxID=906689 RepID=A0A2I0VUF2_9ASPA|nr:hypothetical protein MA16_Dca023160 [Dendrobium catenatum]